MYTIHYTVTTVALVNSPGGLRSFAHVEAIAREDIKPFQCILAAAMIQFVMDTRGLGRSADEPDDDDNESRASSTACRRSHGDPPVVPVLCRKKIVAIRVVVVQ